MKKLFLLPLFLWGVDFKSTIPKIPSIYIPAMCYTKTKDEKGIVHNPCFSCHINSIPPNYVNDYDLQLSYSFPQPALKNPYKNLFKDYTKEVAKISDEEILNYVKTSNYFDKDGNIILAKKLKNLPKNWDSNNNSKWDGYIPDCYYNFDKDGFDRDKNGRFTGWRAFAYMPFLGTFWPTNGSTDDVLIRLPKKFRMLNGKFDKETYIVNFAILEAMIKRKDIKINPVNEKRWGIDLNKDGKLDIAKKIKYDWAPLKNRFMSYVGDAKNEKIAAGLFPIGTEFLHTVRYILPQNNTIKLAPRIKEIRYAKKLFWLNYATLKRLAQSRIVEKNLNPDILETFNGNSERGLRNHFGWVYQGFIEDKNGNLRPQTYTETLSCMGCHDAIGATTDTVFSFPRKLNNYKNGWYYPSEKDLKNVPEFRYKDGTYEYSNYLMLNKSGNEFRTNDEVYNKFFDKNGKPKKEAFEKLHKDVTYLIYPSKKRALMLNKAYRVIVKKQSYIYGKAPHIKPFNNVYKQLKDGQLTGIKKPFLIPYK
ncbi:hypothetical protein FE773_00700 [Caminibacter mediatlanticus TB-2]|uniref:Cytochrome c domain-containing protein n=1 Tax=Caminibacter mediatlanticus TB-2 TaxID=391592 RepID=A0ABX5V8Q2_9BACT|nr:hypothetical protein [Caminibacter mediatlanticus]QCT93757.1 hypothetical protein FE773_00700 [Caminibacter mediatlanticus TB-2]